MGPILAWLLHLELLFFPGYGGNRDEHGVYLQTSEEHAKRENPFSRDRDPRVIFCSADTWKTWADITHGRNNRCDGRCEIVYQKTHDRGKDHETAQKQLYESYYVSHLFFF